MSQTLDAQQVKANVDIVKVISESVQLKRVGKSDRYVGLCPFHQEKTPSFNVDRGKGLYHCFGCGVGGDAFTYLEAKEGLSFPNAVARLAEVAVSIPRGVGRRVVAEYDYVAANGALLYQVVRTEPKGFFQRQPDGCGGWIPKKCSTQVLYRLPEVLRSTIVLVCEGEKDCETLRSRGFVATTNAGGANAPWIPQFNEALLGREVILIPDRDPAGYARVQRIASSLLGCAKRIIYLELEGEGIKDVTDWFNAGHSEVELIAQLEGKDLSA